ncbi:MAG: 4-hydroxy-tetrahydrodipicolinate reductase [Burkholderiaceae bacterium]
MKVAITGASGRMGRTLIEAILGSDKVKLVGALDVAESPMIGTDAGLTLGAQTDVLISSDLTGALAQADCLIDFTRPEGTLAHLQACVEHGVAIVIGTTGFDDDGKKLIAEAAEKIPVVFAPNMSVGVNVTFKLLDMAARILNQGYDVEVIEAHHRHKVDAPSGTALGMGEIIASAQGKDLKTDGVFAREGFTGERADGSIGFATVRGGDIVGDHTVMFAGLGERIEITHRSTGRMNYAQGSLLACEYIGRLPAAKPNGLFDMQDVLGLRQETT